MSTGQKIPCSPKLQIDGVVYFPRMCDKMRLFAAGELHADYHANLGKAMDLWTCQFLSVDYEALKAQVLAGLTDEQALQWCYENGAKPADCVRDWWLSYMRNCGYRDGLSEKLVMRKNDAGLGERDDIQSFFDFIDAEEGR